MGGEIELLFIDESGDDGLVKGSSEFYILAGVALEDKFWKETFWKLFNFRKTLLQRFGLRADEIKGEAIFQHEGVLFNSGLLPDDQRWICESLLDLICDELKADLFVLAKSKREFLHRHPMSMSNPTKIFREETWRGYLSLYEEALLLKSRELGSPQTGLVFYDRNQEKYIRKLVREFTRKFDEQGEFPGYGLIEDVLFYNSKASFFIQLADFLASVSLRIVRGKSEKDTFDMTSEMIAKLRRKAEAFSIKQKWPWNFFQGHHY